MVRVLTGFWSAALLMARSAGGGSQVARKISWLPSALPPVRLAWDAKAMRVPSALIEGEKLPLAVELVTWW